MLQNLQTFFAYLPDESEEIRTEKFAIFLVAGACTLAGTVWTLMYYVIFGPVYTTALPAAFVIIVGTSLIISHRTKNHYYAVYAQIICIMYVTTLIQWSIGGVFDSGFVMAWAFVGPITALMFFPFRRTIIWFVLYVVNIIITVTYNDYFTAHGIAVTDTVKSLFFVMNLGVSSLVVFIFAGYFVNAAISERARANRLLLNILPKEIAAILKTKHTTIADQMDSASVLFADIVGFTPMFAKMEPNEAVEWLNEVFTMFDHLADKYGLEKIKTMGDNYMVAAGVPTPAPDHAKSLIQFALDALKELENLPGQQENNIQFRIGIHSGPLVAGVIGKSKFQYDLWGDTVNIASRMESHGQEGKIQITKATYDLVKDDFQCEYRGKVDVKGKGEMDTWLVVSPAG